MCIFYATIYQKTQGAPAPGAPIVPTPMHMYIMHCVQCIYQSVGLKEANIGR